MRPTEGAEKHLSQLTILSSAIFAGVVVFAVVCWYLVSSGSMPPEDLDLPSWFGLLLNGIALVSLVKGQLIPRVFARPHPKAPEAEHLAWHKKTVLVAFVFREAAAFIALVGGLLTGEMVGAFTIVALALVAMALGWPRLDQLKIKGR